MDCTKYLETAKIEEIIDEMIQECLKYKPDDPIPLILHILETKNGNIVPPLSRKEEIELLHLKARWRDIQRGKEQRSKSLSHNSKITINIEEMKGDRQSQKDQNENSSDTSSSDNETAESFTRDSVLKVKPMGKQPPRPSVSAEAMGLFSKKNIYKPVVVQKDKETKDRVTGRLRASFMFRNLDDKDMEIVVNAMKVVKFKENDIIIKQGDEGNDLYLLESGECEWFKVFPNEKQEKKLREYSPGETFGELALLYNAPRAATIRATEDCLLFALDRETFNNIAKDASK